MGILILNEDNFEREIEGQCGPAVVLCWIPWMGATHIVRRIIENLIPIYETRVKFGIVNSLECHRLRIQYSLNDVTLLFFRDGDLVDLRHGIVSQDEVRTCIEALLMKQSAGRDARDVTLHL